MRDLELEFEAELEDLMGSLTSSNLEAEAEREAPGVSQQAQAVRAQQIVWTQIGKGARDENQITDAVFFDRHPERQGRLLQDNEWALRREWVQIRDWYVRPALFPVTRPSVPAQPSAPKPDPLDVLALSPLPPSENARFLRALDQLSIKVATVVATDPHAWRYECWLEKLRQPDVDDRVIRWGSICPGLGTDLPGRALLGPCYFEEGAIGPQQEALLEQYIHTADDVDRAPRWLRLVTYLKPEVVRIVEWNVALDGLRAAHDTVMRAMDRLSFWANNGIGGSTLMPDAYLAMLNWIAGRQHDARSVYSCM